MSTNKQTIQDVQKKRSLPVSWINSHRKVGRVSQDKRKQPRVDCDCLAVIASYSGNARLTDISLGGCFVALGSGSSGVQIGKIFNLAVKFPTEDRILDFKAKIIRADKRGLACQFVALKQHEREALQRFFDFAKETQPLF
jgi:c-di-GMP-binding flagellar brake protein YcgR